MGRKDSVQVKLTHNFIATLYITSSPMTDRRNIYLLVGTRYVVGNEAWDG
jgi:hypothetical protein